LSPADLAMREAAPRHAWLPHARRHARHNPSAPSTLDDVAIEEHGKQWIVTADPEGNELRVAQG